MHACKSVLCLSEMVSLKYIDINKATLILLLLWHIVSLHHHEILKRKHEVLSKIWKQVESLENRENS